MNNANIGSASNVIGNPVNLIMSNATEDELKKYEGNLGLPSNALIIVNPLQNGTNIDDNWNDICMTDGNNGIKHIIPFTSVNTDQFEISSNNGNRTLSQRFPATSIDTKYFSYTDGVLSLYNNDELKKQYDQYQSYLNDAVSYAKSHFANYENISVRYQNLIDDIKKLSDTDNIISSLNNNLTYFDNKIEENKKNLAYYIKDFSSTYINTIADNVNKVNEKLTYLDNAVKNIDNISYNTTYAINNALNQISYAYNESNLTGIVENVKNEYEAYKAKLDNLVDNTKDELHREYEALKDSLESCVNNNLMPLVEAQVDSCLANEKVASMLEGAVDKVLLNEFIEPCCTCDDGNKYDQNGNKIDENQTIKNSDVAKAITNTVAEALKDPNMNIGTLNALDKALGGDGDADTASEAGSNVRDSVAKISADKASVAVENVVAMVSQATQPKYVDKRFFRVMKLGEVDSDPSIPDSMKELPVLTFSKSLTEKILTLFTPGANEHGAEAF